MSLVRMRERERVRIRESPYYRRFFLRKYMRIFIGTLETVRNREVSVPRGSTVTTFRLFINENSAVNAMYGVFVITPLKSRRRFEPAPVIWPIFFGPLVTVLTGFHCTKNKESLLSFLKELCHEDNAVLGQFCAEVISL